MKSEIMTTAREFILSLANSLAPCRDSEKAGLILSKLQASFGGLREMVVDKVCIPMGEHYHSSLAKVTSC